MALEHGKRKILLYRPAHLWLAAAAAAVLLGVAGYLLFRQGMMAAGTELVQLQMQRKEQEQRIRKQQQEILEMRAQIAVLQRSSEIDRLASGTVREEFAALRNELAEARRELQFYRGVLAPGDAEPGLRIQKFNVEPAQESDSFLYSLTLTQVKRNDRYVSGVMDIRLEGSQDGKRRSLPFEELIIGDKEALKYRFRYFQHFDGEIRLPPGFTPDRVMIRVSPRGTGQPPGIEETMEWPL